MVSWVTEVLAEDLQLQHQELPQKPQKALGQQKGDRQYDEKQEGFVLSEVQE